MTRETKIGLLVGLGFIVVFAVLLSHTGTVPPPGGNANIALVQKTPPGKSLLDGQNRPEIGQRAPAMDAQGSQAPGSSPEAEPSRRPVDMLVDSKNGQDGLPNPEAFNPSPTSGLADAHHRRSGDLLGDIALPPMVTAPRVAPPVSEPIPEPQPTVRTDTPVVSPTPKPDMATAIAMDTGGKMAPDLKAGPAREHVVQKGETLNGIAKKYYNSSKPRDIQVIVKSNEGRIKNPNSITQGTKLSIPNLPPEMFENVGELDVRTATTPVKTGGKDEAKPQTRKAPPGAQPTPPKAEASTPPAHNPGSTTPPAPTGNVVPLVGNSTPPSGMFDPILTGSKPGSPSSIPPSTTVREDVKDPTAAKPTGKDSKSANDNKAKDSKPKSGIPKALPATVVTQRDEIFRWYEIKPKDTPSSIAKNELGSSQKWTEIKKLNNGLDPQKMKPGERIKLPRKPVSTALSGLQGAKT